MTTECAICYVSDINFLFPTVVSATHLRKFIPAHKAAVYIFVIDEDPTYLQEIGRFLEPHAIQIIPMSSHLFSGFDEKQWNITHVPKSALGRFFIPALLPTGHKRILYLDGDTLTTSDPSPLIDFVIPDGKLAAVEDISYFSRNDFTSYGKTVRQYFKGLGIDGDKGYFNSGVFLVSTDTWATLSQEAYNFFKNNIGVCRYHDQSALNAVVGDRRLRLPLAWNFQTPYWFWDVAGKVNPKIYHFTQSFKPWMGPAGPWADMYPVYEKEIQNLSSLKLPRKLFSANDIEQANALTAREVQKLHYLLPLRLLSRRKDVQRLDAGAVNL